MKTIIPDQLKFDLNLSDLPARAENVSSAALSLFGSTDKDPSRCEYVETGIENPFDSMNVEITPGIKSGFCNRWCIQDYGSRYCASPGADAEAHFPGSMKPNGYQSWLCLCYKKTE